MLSLSTVTLLVGTMYLILGLSRKVTYDIQLYTNSHIQDTGTFCAAQMCAR